MKLPLSLYRLLLVCACGASVSAWAAAIPGGYTPVTINSSEEFANFTPEESVNYSFIMGNGVGLTAGDSATLLPAGSVWVQAEGTLQLMGAEGVSYLFTGDAFTLAEGGDVSVSGWHAATGVHRVARGAISTNTLTIQDNAGKVSFSDCSSETNGAVITVGVDGTATLSNNTGSVSFENNTANYGGSAKSGRGAAIYLDAGADLSVRGNADVSFTGNKTRQEGGAIYASTLATNRATISFEGNTKVTFSDNVSASLGGDGGAIYGAEISFTDNTEVIFSGNQCNKSTSAGGGAIYLGAGSTDQHTHLTFTGNDKVSFIGNKTSKGDAYGAGSGGAIRIAGSTDTSDCQEFTLSNNGDVLFSGNQAGTDPTDSTSKGGAIYAEYAVLLMEGNRSLTFEENYSGSYGAAIYGNALKIAGNDEVRFRGNYEAYNNRLRSIYIKELNNSKSDSFELDAKTGGHITFYDSVYVATVDSTISLNAEGEGDIIFSGEFVREDLERMSGAAATDEQVAASSKSELLKDTVLHGGRLAVREGATLNVAGLTVGGSDKAAVLELRNGTLDLNAKLTYPTSSTQQLYNLTFGAGATLELEGSNTITANQVTVAEGSTWIFTLSDLLGEGEALLNFNASLQNGSALTINVLGASSASGQVALLTGVNASEWSQVTWTGIDNNLLRWDGNTLYANLGTLVSTDYWVNSGQNALYADGSDAAAEPITRVILNGGTLTMEQNLREGVSLRVDQASTVKLEQGVTLASGSLSSDNGSTVTLDGAGVYDLGHSTDQKGALASTWTGEVRIGNGGSGSAVTSISELDLGQYGNENSTIVLGHLDGSLKDGMTVEADVRLEGSSEAAVALKNGADGATYTFAGAVTTGSGANFIVDMKREQNFLFTGDVSGWQGLFQSTKDNNAGGSDDYGVTNITFAASENAASADIGTTIRAANGNTVNLTIENATRDVVVTGKVSDKSQWDGESGQYNGTMNVVVDTNGHTTSFRQGLEIDSLTVKSGSEVKVGVAGQEGVTLKANDESGEAVLTNVDVTETSLVRHDAEQQAKVQNVKVWLAGGTQATVSDMELASTCVEVTAGGTLNLMNVALDAQSSINATNVGSSALLSGSNSLTVTNVTGGQSGGVWTLETSQLAGVTLEAGSDLTLGLSFTPGNGGVLEVLLTDFTWASLTSGELEGENELLEAFLLEMNPGGLKVTADKAEATESGLRLSFTLAPEPTTATLSLLALGLLAGRRRRK